ncbi:hypothetical protein SLEP1_g19488 [Rubroshorea leprosula]|uniref:J domain-containing protein n=1 Tax=Rubroshorea leprosula TaxID=152421 RepID=A0AAV5IZI6_9ROSI|nr:hypothetical protein SLEP1_g19488 [Rubroshorea leprosula]
MLASMFPLYKVSVPKSCPFDGHFNSKKSSNPRLKHRTTLIRCCQQRVGERERTRRRMKENYYELLGVSVDSNPQEIKEAYRKLQKKHHPDIAGQEGHEYTLLLNEAYGVLIREDLRRDYDASIGQVRFRRNVSASGLGYSSWRGPLRTQALFVDGNACIGCRECIHHASNTFVMDEATACARVKVQYGDDDQKIEVSVDSCPVNCIHWVDSEELPVLEFLIQPQPKEGHGVFGGGWERPTNVFMAAKAFAKQLKQEPASDFNQRNARATADEETPAQVEARINASMKIKMASFVRVWDFFKAAFSSGTIDGE